ncbi:MAG: hypothetical protein MPN21_12930 [Thermoanaerobaculia bacterium]|nr:hypothetical protein [Thermoanaerobaculia bacterium]
MSTPNHPCRWTAVWLLVLVALLLSSPALAQPDEGDTPLVKEEDAVWTIVEKGDGWLRAEISDASDPRRGVVSDLLFVTPGSIKDLPLSDKQKEELRGDFGPQFTGSKDVDSSLDGFEDPLAKPATRRESPDESADKNSCSPSPPPGGGNGGIIIVDLQNLQEAEHQKALYGLDGEHADKAFEKGCFGWNDKKKTKTWSLVENSISDSFNLGGGFTGSYNVQLPFQTQGTATLRYRVKKAACIPYKFQFKNVQATGDVSLAGDASISASATLGYEWEKEWQVMNPSLGRISFWVGFIPVWIDFSLPTYVGLGLDAEATASVDLGADFGAAGSFDYTCNTDDCCGEEDFQDHFDTQSVSASLEAKINARAKARVALRAELWDDSLAFAEAGVGGFAGAEVWGYYGNACGDADGDGDNETVEALVADAEAGYDWRFEIGGALLPDKDWTREGGRFHLGFWDLLGDGGSTALSPVLAGPDSVTVGETATYTAKMRPCYPYSESVRLSIGPGSWNGNPVIAKPKSNQAAENSTSLSRTFSQAGTETIRLTALDDAQGRELGVLTERDLEIEADAIAAPLEGLWYNPARSGNGISFTSNSFDDYLLVWFTYKSNGSPIWYMSGTAPMSGSNWSSTLYKVTMNGAGAVSSTIVGEVGLDFSSTSQGTFSWTLNGQSGSEPYRFLHGAAGRTGSWYPPSESGWGLDVSDGGGTLVVTAMIYAGGQPTWVQGVGASSSNATLSLSRFTSPDLCPSCGGSTPPTSTPAGSLNLRIASGSSMSGLVSTSIDAAGTIWQRSNLPISRLTAP